jgi:hypothetical protein
MPRWGIEPGEHMHRTFLPTGDNELYNWALNFSTLLTANYAAYTLPQSVATTYSSKFNTC